MISKLPQSQASILGGRRSFYRVYARETLEICHLRWFSADSRLLTSHFNLKYTKPPGEQPGGDIWVAVARSLHPHYFNRNANRRGLLHSGDTQSVGHLLRGHQIGFVLVVHHGLRG